MNFYRTIRFDGDEFPRWDGTLSEAHDTAKTLTAGDALRIELFDVWTDRDHLLDLLNGADANDIADGPKRTWMLTPRKGLKEIANGE
jgi:hypothetical protein